MPLVNNKVGDEGRAGAVADGKALVDSLMRVSCSKYEATLRYVWPLIINTASSECQNPFGCFFSIQNHFTFAKFTSCFTFEMQFHLPWG